MYVRVDKIPANPPPPHQPIPLPTALLTALLTSLPTWYTNDATEIEIGTERERGCHAWVVVPNANLFTDLTHVLWCSNLHLHSFEWRCTFDFPCSLPLLTAPPHWVQFGRHGRRNRILARFRPPHTPSAEHAPTPAHPRTPAHLLDINNPDCYLVKKNHPAPFFLYIEISPSPRLPVSPSPRLTYLVS